MCHTHTNLPIQWNVPLVPIFLGQLDHALPCKMLSANEYELSVENALLELH